MAPGQPYPGHPTIEAETNEDTYTSPDLIVKSHRVAKAYVVINAAGAIERAGTESNVASVTDTGTENRTIVFATDFADVAHVAVRTSVY